MIRLARTVIDTPVGRLQALASDDGLCALEFVEPDRESRLAARLQRWFAPYEIHDQSLPVIDRARDWLEAYFAGTYGAAVPLEMRGAPFERRVWAELQAIPPGTTATYGDIAKRIGSPGAARAVGMANGANTLAIIVPCHRVVGARGALTGYGGGLTRKAWLLGHEAAMVQAPSAAGQGRLVWSDA